MYSRNACGPHHRQPIPKMPCAQPDHKRIIATESFMGQLIDFLMSARGKTYVNAKQSISWINITYARRSLAELCGVSMEA